MSETPEPRTYEGGCHCGAVRYAITTDLARVIECDCSICTKTGTLLTFVPASSFRLIQGEDALTDYQFNKKWVHHYFCPTCGIRSFVAGKTPDGKELRGANVRCLDGVELGALTLTRFHGADL
ncbi:MAG: GFA family protein [Myxococcales bacterium]|nr:GFA family protein [Myxococcales bacterium]